MLKLQENHKPVTSYIVYSLEKAPALQEEILQL